MPKKLKFLYLNLLYSPKSKIYVQSIYILGALLICPTQQNVCENTAR